MLLATGSYADLHGRRKATLIGLVIVATASVACGIAANYLTLNLARGVQGVGGAFLLTASLMVFFLPLFLQNAHGYEPLVAGIAMLPFAAPMVLAPRLTSNAVDSC